LCAGGAERKLKRMIPRLFLFPLAGLAALAACSGSTVGSSSAGAGGVAACTWPASLDDADAAPGACHARRAMVQCQLPDGVTEGCLSDDPTQCPGAPDAGGTCTDQCAQDEYAVACGQVGPGPIGTPPAGCRSLGAIPAGIVYYCCPCGA
jgi:hypothetical protein